MLTDAPSALDVTPPTQPVVLQVVEQRRAVRIRWKPAEDDIGVTGYTIWRDGNILGETQRLHFTDREVSPGTTHEYWVTSFDAAGNNSVSSAEVTAGAVVPSPLGQ